MEWDLEAEQGGPGKHDGAVDGVRYFTPEFHCESKLFKEGGSKCASFVRHGKVQIGGIDIEKAIKQQYMAEDELDDESKEAEKEEMAKELYV